jgi:hypothetical protein
MYMGLVVSCGEHGAQQGDRCDAATETIVARGFQAIFLPSAPFFPANKAM